MIPANIVVNVVYKLYVYFSCSQTKKAVAVTKIKDFDLVRGILAVVLSSFSSIAGNLSDKLAEFIVGQISRDYVEKCFSVLSSFDSDDVAVALPLLTQTCAILANMKGWGSLSPDTILDNFIRIVSVIHDMQEKSSQERNALVVSNAAATAEMLCVLNMQVDVVFCSFSKSLFFCFTDT